MKLVNSTIQKHSRWASSPTGVASQASSHATSVVTIVKPQASPMLSVPEGSGRFGLFTRSMSRS